MFGETRHEVVRDRMSKIRRLTQSNEHNGFLKLVHLWPLFI